MINWEEDAGFAVIPQLIPSHELRGLIDEAERLFARHGRRPAGVRRVLTRSRVFAELARSDRLAELIAPVLGRGAFPVRSLLFDKSPEANWDVGRHQDTTIAVQARAEVSGYGPWSVKEGVPHVRPPVEVLVGMLAVRVNLDPSGDENGPLLVAPGSHRDGIRDDACDAARFGADQVACVTDAGGAVLMRPLVFHASRKAACPTHRRVLHLEYAAQELPKPLRWAGE